MVPQKSDFSVRHYLSRPNSIYNIQKSVESSPAFKIHEQARKDQAVIEKLPKQHEENYEALISNLNTEEPEEPEESKELNELEEPEDLNELEEPEDLNELEEPEDLNELDEPEELESKPLKTDEKRSIELKKQLDRLGETAKIKGLPFDKTELKCSLKLLYQWLQSKPGTLFDFKFSCFVSFWHKPTGRRAIGYGLCYHKQAKKDFFTKIQN